MPRTYKNKEQLFWEKIDKKDNPNECWNWIGASTRHYGAGHYAGKTYRSHRLVWELTYGEIPEGMYVLHKCDNPKCCNPNHLFLGTQEENNRDRARKNRSAHLIGGLNPNKRFNDGDIILIRTLYKEGMTQTAIGKLMGTGQGTIKDIVLNKTWKHLL